jgi:DNA-binding transcriptional regulator YbjK
VTRRAEVADAAIRALAKEGLRGLTHRSVDDEAGLPQGSTSYYFRTREALVKAVIERFTEVVTHEIPPLPPVSDTDAFAKAAVEVVRTLTTTGRAHQLACYELTLEANRRPGLRELLVPASTHIRTAVAQRLQEAGVASPESRAHGLVAFLDGLIFDQITAPEERRLSEDELRTAVRTLVEAFLT